MNRKARTLWIIFLIVHLFSNTVIGIVDAHNDIQDKSVVSAENISIFSEHEGKNELNNKVISDDQVLNKYDANLNLNENVRDEARAPPIFAEAASQNAGVLNDITTGSTPVELSIPETASLELQAKVEELSASVVASELESVQNRTRLAPEPASEVDENTLDIQEPRNDTNLAQNQTSDAPEDIPSFSEWAQKRLQEAEKNEEVLNESSQHLTGSNGKLGSGVKLGWKNYASPDCGAKVVAANPEAVSPSSVISPSREEYKLNVCTNRIWFIIELCEAIQAKKVDIANFELFSSTPKDFTVSVGDRFPSREWTTVGQFIAKDEREVQSFDLNPYLFGRYIKVEVKSHHGSQHYCPISLFRVYGISEMEVLQKEELSHSDEEDDDDDDASASTYTDDLTKNMLNSATNAVYSMIKKAAEVLGTKSNATEDKNITDQTEYVPLIYTCSTPCYRIVCTNCSDILFGQIYELLSCKSVPIYNLASIPFIQRSLMNSHICQNFGVNLNSAPSDRSMFNRSSMVIKSFFSKKILGAMCNSLAIFENKAVLNISQQFPNITKTFNETEENLANIQTTKINLKVEESIDLPIPEIVSEIRPTDELKLDSNNNIELPRATCSTDLTYTSQIKPTKTVTIDVLVKSSIILSGNETEELSVQATQIEIPPSEGVTENEEKPMVAEEKVNETHSTDAQIEVTTESSENIDHMENFMSEMHSEGGPSTLPSVSSNNIPNDRQKESVFLRLSNRIKALERNVSLSSQYLEELSRRYKKQVEEMQKLLEKTLQTVAEEYKKIDDRNKKFEERLDHLMAVVGKWPSFILWFFFTLAATCVILWICRNERQKNKTVPSENIERRKSIDVIPSTEKKPKVRRPSDQALKIVRTSLIAEERKLSREKRRRKRSNRGMKRSNSMTGFESDEYRARENGSTQYVTPKCSTPRFSPERIQDLLSVGHSRCLSNPCDWVEENQRLLEVISLDESEHSSLEPISSIVERDVPPYTKTAIDSRALRISSQQDRPNINGDPKLPAILPRKCGSLDESNRINSSFTRRSSLNSSLDGNRRKKEKRSFKSVLKNVFT